MNNQKGFANIVLIVVIVILVGAVGYFAFVKKSEPIVSPTPTVKDETAGWKTYMNSKHNYSFKYPKDWLLGDSPKSLTPSLTADDIAFDSSQYTAARFVVQVTSQSNCSSLEDCVTKNRKSFTPDQQTTGTVNTTVGSKSALIETITRPTSGDWKYYVWYVIEGGKLYTLHTISLATDDGIVKPTFDQILSTFKFTN